MKGRPLGILLAFGGQVPNNHALACAEARIPVFGTQPRDIDRAEDRHKFSSLLDRLGVPQPEWAEVTSRREAVRFAARVGYPVLVRPSYVLSGAGMRIPSDGTRSEEHTSELQSRLHLVCRLLLEKKKNKTTR